MSDRDDSLAEDVSRIMAKYRHDPNNLLQMLREVQESRLHIPGAAMEQMAQTLQVPQARIEGVAGFYSFLHTEPVGDYRVLFSDNITDQMLGSRALMDRLCNKLWLESGKLSEDKLVSVDVTSCTGMCDQGPALLVNGWPITRLTSERIDQIADLIRARRPVAEWPSEFFRVDDQIRRRDVLLSGNWAPGEAIRAALGRGADNMLSEMKISNLRGRGGAGFTTAVKWDSCRNAAVPEGQPERYVVCNADEGEPGTFKDRVLINSYAELLFDGMTVAGYTIGASKGFLYLRGEYRYMLEALEANLERRRKNGLLGTNVGGAEGFNFDIEIHLGCGAYVCGEESALIESLEGKRGIPRIRPPFPVTHGYLGQPTVVNNVETLCKAAMIAIHGGEWFAGLGTKQSTGTKLISVSGDCEHPGIYEYAMGVSIERILNDCGAGNAQAVQVSGAAGQCLAPHEFGRKVAFEDVSTAGSFMVFGPDRDIFEMSLNFAHFFAHESCGFCTPCRVGTTLVKGFLDKIDAGSGTMNEINELFKIHRLMQTSSHCGLGQSACNHLFDTLQKFRPAYERRLKSLDFEPAFDLDKSLAYARQMTGRDDPAAHIGVEQ